MDFRKSADEIQNEMLSNIDNSYEKSKGYFLWDILKAISIRLKVFLENLQKVSNELDIEQLTGGELDRFIYQRTGLKRKQATYSEGILSVIGNGVIKTGDLFETEGFLRYEAIETTQIIGNGSIKIRAVFTGVAGNVPARTIVKIPITISGISSCINNDPTSKGYEIESDEDFLKRYYERIRIPATSGNKYHYRRWALEVSGVGDARVFPLWNGNNTVKVVIINQDRQPASMELVKSVQNYIDPEITGVGKGEAPIGAFCTVVSANEKQINISVKVKVSYEYEMESIKESIQNEIIHYLASIAFQKDYLSYAVVGASILNVDGVLDYEDLKLNGKTQNIKCTEYEVMTLGSVKLLE